MYKVSFLLLAQLSLVECAEYVQCVPGAQALGVPR